MAKSEVRPARATQNEGCGVRTSLPPLETELPAARRKWGQHLLAGKSVQLRPNAMSQRFETRLAEIRADLATMNPVTGGNIVSTFCVSGVPGRVLVVPVHTAVRRQCHARVRAGDPATESSRPLLPKLAALPKFTVSLHIVGGPYSKSPEGCHDDRARDG